MPKFFEASKVKTIYRVILRLEKYYSENRKLFFEFNRVLPVCMKKAFALLCIFSASFSIAKEYDGIIISNNEQIIDISDKIRYYHLETSDFDPINHLGTDASKISQHSVKARRAVVAKFTMTNSLEEELFIQISNPAIDRLILVKDDGKEKKVIYEGGLDYKKYIDNIRLSKYLIDLKSKDEGQVSYTLFIVDDKPLENLSLNVGTLKKFFDDKPEINLLEGMFFGIFLLLVFYNLFQYFSIRDYSYIYFGFYSATLLLLFAVYKGYTIEYFLGEIPEFGKYVKLLVCAAGVVSLLFTMEFLKTVINTPRRHIWLLSFIIFYIISAVTLLFEGEQLANSIIYYNSVFAIIFIIFISLNRTRNGFKPALYYLMAWCILLVGIGTAVMREHELIPYNLFTEHILQFSVLAHTIVLSFAMANKVRIYIDKKNEAQEIALKTAMENEKLIIHQKQMLETKVFERTKDLEQSIETLKKQEEELKEANLFKDKVFSVISHDLKSPVSSLTGMLELLKLNSLSREEKSKIIENLDLALKSTKNLLENILIWANPKLGNGKQISRFDLQSIIDEVFQLFSLQAKAKKISLVSYVYPGIKVKTDKNVLRLVLRNLISNALKFTGSGGKIEVSIEIQNQNITLMIKDNGIGISEKDQQALFNRNRHYSTRGTENEKGTGLGLMLCKEFLEKSNGQISVKSHPGKGTTFFITLSKVLQKKLDKVAV